MLPDRNYRRQVAFPCVKREKTDLIPVFPQPSVSQPSLPNRLSPLQLGKTDLTRGWGGCRIFLDGAFMRRYGRLGWAVFSRPAENRCPREKGERKGQRTFRMMYAISFCGSPFYGSLLGFFVRPRRCMMRFTLLMGCCLFLPALASAQEKRDPDGPESILKEIAKAFKDDRTVEQIKKDNALIRAAAKGDANAIRKALKDGARINSRYIDGYAFLDEGESGYTALMFAVLNKRTDAIKLLIENKSDIEVKNYEGCTALYLAVTGDNTEAVDMLVSAGAKQDPTKIRLAHKLIRAACKGFKLRDGEGFPPYPGGFSDEPPGSVLRELSKKPLPADQLGDPSDIIKLLDKKADINMPDPKGYTPLMYAANLGLVENVKTLLAKGADATLKSADGESALSLAEREGSMFRLEERRQVVKVLKEHVAKKR
jgi:hypothetical protein